MDSNFKNRLVSRDEAAEHLGVKSRTLATWASTNRYALPYVKVGRCVRYRLSDLASFVEANTQNIQSDGGVK